MKKLILTIAIAVTGVMATAQIEVKTQAKTDVVWQATKLSNVPNITAFISDEDSTYALYYRNAEYQYIVEIDYIPFNSKDEVLQFRDLCLSVANGGDNMIVDINGETFSITKSSWTVMVRKSGSFFYLSKKQLESIEL